MGHFENGRTKALKEIGSRLNNSKKSALHIEVDDPDGQLKGLIEYIGKLSAPGHSFEVVVDPNDSEYRKPFGIDGDGAFRIKSVKEI